MYYVLLKIKTVTEIKLRGDKEIEQIPNFNIRLRLGLEYFFRDYELLFYGDIYKNNLIGFEPITFNQRTESYFNKSFGELGINISISF